MGVPDTVEDKQWPAVFGPAARLLRIQIEERARTHYRHDPAVQDRAGNASEFGLVDPAVRLAGASEEPTERPDLLFHAIFEKQPFDPARVACEQGAHSGKSADALQFTLVLHFHGARMSNSC